MTRDPSLLTQARTMVLQFGGLTQTMIQRLFAAGYPPSFVAALVNTWKGSPT